MRTPGASFFLKKNCINFYLQVNYVRIADTPNRHKDDNRMGLEPFSLFVVLMFDRLCMVSATLAVSRDDD